MIRLTLALGALGTLGTLGALTLGSALQAQPQLTTDMSGTTAVEGFVFGQGQLELAQFLAAECPRHVVDVTHAATDYAARYARLEDFLGDRDISALEDGIQIAQLKATDMVQEYMVERQLVNADPASLPACGAIDTELSEGTYFAKFFGG